MCVMNEKVVCIVWGGAARMHSRVGVGGKLVGWRCLVIRSDPELTIEIRLLRDIGSRKKPSEASLLQTT